MPPLIVILGETASGKSALALELAKQFSGEIICADSRTIYKGMDIGTAKPTIAERKYVSHHLLDVIEPSESFSAAQFKAQAMHAIDDVTARGKVPFLVGGTGLYIDAVLFDFEFRAMADLELRTRLERLSIEELQSEIVDRGYAMPENSRNKRYLIRTLETGGAMPMRNELRQNTLIISTRVARDELEKRIIKRVDAMVTGGLVEECRQLIKQYDVNAPGFNATGYKAFTPYIHNEYTLDQAKVQFILNDLHLAKKQRTWFRRKIYQNVIQYVKNREQAVDLVTTYLNK